MDVLIAMQGCPSCHSLEQYGGLVFPDANLTDKVKFQEHILGLLYIFAIRADLRIQNSMRFCFHGILWQFEYTPILELFWCRSPSSPKAFFRFLGRS